MADVLERLIEISPELLALFAGLILGIATVIRIGAFIKSLFFKKSKNQFRANVTFRKWLAFSMDLLAIAFIAVIVMDKYRWDGMEFFILICVGIRIALYFAIKAETK